MNDRATEVTVCPDGPLLVRGPVVIQDAEGQPVEHARRTLALCRCGRSARKPLCDGSHQRSRFHDPADHAALTDALAIGPHHRAVPDHHHQWPSQQGDSFVPHDQYTPSDPTRDYADITPTAQYQSGPGTDAALQQPADLGEESYRGSGRLTGRRALITGGDSGIGAATAIAFAREGADVALSFLPEEQTDAQRIATLVEQAGRQAVLIPGDLTDVAYCRTLVAETVEKLGGLDILINNGGKQQHVEALADLTDEQFDETFKTNVYAMFWLVKAALPHLTPGSAIINTSSIQAYNPSPNLLDYATTKAAINAFSKGLAQQLAPQGIRVNVVAPGPVWTPLQTAGGQPSEELPSFGSATPLGRPGQPAELAPAFVFLASAESSYVAGETLNVNGGSPTP